MYTLIERFGRLEKRRLILLKKISCLPDEIKYQHPKPGKWSIVQILEHLRVAEKQTLKSIQRNIENTGTLQESGIHSDIGLFIARLRFSTRIPLKAPSYVSNIAERPDINYMLDDWQKVRNEYKTLIENLPASLNHKIIFKHPIVGPMSIFHVLGFFNAHFSVHERQVLRIVSQTKSTK